MTTTTTTMPSPLLRRRRRRGAALPSLLRSALALLLSIATGSTARTGASGGRTAVAEAASMGVPHSTVVKLHEKNFDVQLSDPANGLWLIKFYAPWCGHCKTLAPVLDAVAPHLAGKMAVGKVDCTVEKKLCKRFDVRGYPTLKYYRDGTHNDYPLGRDKDSIITFGERMSDRAVKIVSTYEEAKAELLSKIPVAYVVHDPAAPDASSEAIDASGATDEEKAAEKLVRSTERTRAFGQVARKMQAQGSFGLLKPDAGRGEVAAFFRPLGAFVARIEEEVPTEIYEGEVTTDAVEEWVKARNIAAVVELGGHNFRFASRRGKAMAIGVYDPDDEARTDKFKRELKRYAVGGEHRGDYVFGTMDGKRWEKFVGQFSIAKENLPELFLIDVPERTYWQDASVFGISEFVAAVRRGEIAPREQEKAKSGPLDELARMFVDYMPWTLFAMLALFATVFYLALQRMDDGGLERPSMPPPPPRRPEEEGRGGKKEAGKEAGDAETKKEQ